jgi:hypothetical protein
MCQGAEVKPLQRNPSNGTGKGSRGEWTEGTVNDVADSTPLLQGAQRALARQKGRTETASPIQWRV